MPLSPSIESNPIEHTTTSFARDGSHFRLGFFNTQRSSESQSLRQTQAEPLREDEMNCITGMSPVS